MFPFIKKKEKKISRLEGMMAASPRVKIVSAELTLSFSLDSDDIDFDFLSACLAKQNWDVGERPPWGPWKVHAGEEGITPSPIFLFLTLFLLLLGFGLLEVS